MKAPTGRLATERIGILPDGSGRVSLVAGNDTQKTKYTGTPTQQYSADVAQW